MLLEQDQMVRNYRWHLTFAFGLLEPLLRLSILFLAHQKHTECLVTIQLLTLASQYASGGPGGYCPHVQYVYAVPLNDLSNLYLLRYLIFKFFHLRSSNSTMI